MLTIETNNPDIDVNDLMHRVDEEVKKIKKTSLPFRNIVFSVHDRYDKIKVLPPIELKDYYHINELIGLQGDHFVESAYRALIQKEADPKVLEQYKLLFRQGILNKKEILGKLRYSPEGKKKNVQIKGLLIPYTVQQAFRIPVIGIFFRIIICILRLPVIFQTIQRLDNMLVVCSDELDTKVSADDYRRNLKRISLAFQMTEQRTIDLLQELEEKNCSK